MSKLSDIINLQLENINKNKNLLKESLRVDKIPPNIGRAVIAGTAIAAQYHSDKIRRERLAKQLADMKDAKAAEEARAAEAARATETARETSKGISKGTLEKFKDKVSEYGHAAKEKASEYGHAIKDKASQYGLVIDKEKASQYGRAAREKASEYEHAIKDKASEYGLVDKSKAAQLAELVKEHPKTAAALAAGTALGAGLGAYKYLKAKKNKK